MHMCFLSNNINKNDAHICNSKGDLDVKSIKSQEPKAP